MKTTIQAHVITNPDDADPQIVVYAADENGAGVGPILAEIPLTLNEDEEIVEDIPALLAEAGYRTTDAGDTTDYGWACEVEPTA